MSVCAQEAEWQLLSVMRTQHSRRVDLSGVVHYAEMKELFDYKADSPVAQAHISSKNRWSQAVDCAQHAVAD